jgi:hypothetical protein
VVAVAHVEAPYTKESDTVVFVEDWMRSEVSEFGILRNYGGRRHQRPWGLRCFLRGSFCAS